MDLEDWNNNGWLRPHKTSSLEISGLFSIIRRDLHDAKSRELSSDWKFGIAYNAALKLCTVLLYASGFKAEKNLQHFRTIAALPIILGDGKVDDANYLETCRVKRNTVEYDLAGMTSDAEALELIQFAELLHYEVLEWLEQMHPQLAPPRKDV